MKFLYTNDSQDCKMSLYVKKEESPIETCDLYKNKELALIGVSLGNSYFSECRLKLIISGFSENFKNVVVLLVDDLSFHNYKAMGYDDDKAKKKVKKKSKNIQGNRGSK